MNVNFPDENLDQQINIDNTENIKLILDLSPGGNEEAYQIEYDSICPPISSEIPEEFFYDDSKDIIEVEFKGARRGYYYKEKELHLTTRDYVLVEAEKGNDLGRVYLTGDLVHIKRKGQVLRRDIVRKVLKKANQEDIQKMLENRELEENAFHICRKKIETHTLLMKLIDVEYQYDRNRVTFYFTSDKRIDFRELVKDLAAEYRTRIELRQIGVRDEAKMIGGISSCGRELCCSTWLNDFKRITTQTARVQMLHLNPVKLSGQCGRLKCCLMYELESYSESLKKFPQIDSMITTEKGEGVIEKVDVFKDILYIHYPSTDSWEKYDLKEFYDLISKNHKNLA
jgi:cell fate regulator YaaT (PSP1 superfamily)